MFLAFGSVLKSYCSIRNVHHGNLCAIFLSVFSATYDNNCSMDKWMSRLESSGWLSHVKEVLTTACLVAQCVDRESKYTISPSLSNLTTLPSFSLPSPPSQWESRWVDFIYQDGLVECEISTDCSMPCDSVWIEKVHSIPSLPPFSPFHPSLPSLLLSLLFPTPLPPPFLFCLPLPSKWMSRLESPGWLSHVKEMLTTACLVAQCVDRESKFTISPPLSHSRPSPSLPQYVQQFNNKPILAKIPFICKFICDVLQAKVPCTLSRLPLVSDLQTLEAYQ